MESLSAPQYASFVVPTFQWQSNAVAAVVPHFLDHLYAYIMEHKCNVCHCRLINKQPTSRHMQIYLLRQEFYKIFIADIT
jgi:hypothetical protein